MWKYLTVVYKELHTDDGWIAYKEEEEIHGLDGWEAYSTMKWGSTNSFIVFYKKWSLED